MAHTAGAALRLGIDEKKFDAVWEYRSSPLYSEAERVALDFSIAGASQPNDVSDELFARMKQHWNEGQIVEILGVVSMFGFMNRWNDSMATPLEEEPVEVGEKHLAKRGWNNETVNGLLAWMSDNQATGADGAKHFLQTQPELWKTWVSAEAAAKIEASL